MKHNYFKYFVQLLIVTQFCFVSSVSCNSGDNNWIEPDAWTRNHLSLNSLQSSNGKCCNCPDDIFHQDNAQQSPNRQQKVSVDAASLIYFKKFITMLFNRKYLIHDSTLQSYTRSIVFTLKPSELDKLEQLQDPRDLDSILTEIFANVRICDDYKQQTPETSGFTFLVYDIFYDMWQLTKISEIRFLLFFTAMLLIVWNVNTRFNIGWLSLIFGSLFVYGYLHTYLECNRELEINEMREFLDRNKGSQNVAGNFGILNFLKSFFYSGKSQELEEQKLKPSTKISLGFCRPDHVLIIYFNDLFLKYLQLLLEQCTNTLTTLNGSLSFPYNILSGFFLICLIGYILKLTFKYILSPKAWLQFVGRKHQQPLQSEQASLTNTKLHNDDRLSGDNLKLLLNALNATLPPLVSGAEELNNAIEASSENNYQNIEKHSLIETPNNNNSNEEIVNEKKKVTSKELIEES